MYPGAHSQVRPLHRRMQERARGAHAAPFENRTLRVIDAELTFAVVVRIARNTLADRARDERVAERMMLVDIGDGQSAFASAKRVVALPDAALQPLEIRQHVRVAPAAVTALRPAVVVQALPAVVDVPV